MKIIENSKSPVKVTWLLKTQLKVPRRRKYVKKLINIEPEKFLKE